MKERSLFLVSVFGLCSRLNDGRSSLRTVRQAPGGQGARSSLQAPPSLGVSENQPGASVRASCTHQRHRPAEGPQPRRLRLSPRRAALWGPLRARGRSSPSAYGEPGPLSMDPDGPTLVQAHRGLWPPSQHAGWMGDAFDFRSLFAQSSHFL